MNRQELRKIAGQLIMIRFPGTVLDEATAEFIRTNSIRG
jgi:beta-N-acetylhexosaminidase